MVTTGASVLRTMMTCRPLVSVARKTSGSAGISLVAARLADSTGQREEKNGSEQNGPGRLIFGRHKFDVQTTISAPFKREKKVGS